MHIFKVTAFRKACVLSEMTCWKSKPWPWCSAPLCELQEHSCEHSFVCWLHAQKGQKCYATN